MENTFSITFQLSLKIVVLRFSLAYFAHRQQQRSKISLENNYKDSPLRMSMKYASEFLNNLRNRTRKQVLITLSHGNQDCLLLLQPKPQKNISKRKLIICILFTLEQWGLNIRKGVKRHPLKYLGFILKETEISVSQDHSVGWQQTQVYYPGSLNPIQKFQLASSLPIIFTTITVLNRIFFKSIFCFDSNAVSKYSPCLFVGESLAGQNPMKIV